MSEIQAGSKVVKFGGLDVTVRELTLGDYAKVGEALSKVAGRTSIFDAFKGDDPDTGKMAKAMADLMIIIPNDIAELIELSTGVKVEHIMKATAPQVLDLMMEIWKMNNLVELFGKKMGGFLGKEEPEAPEPESPQSTSGTAVKQD